MTFEIIKNALNEHYGAAIGMLEQNLKICPKEVWDDRTRGPPFWHVAYHAMWFLDWYLSDSKKARESFKSKFGDSSSHFEQLEFIQLLLFLTEKKPITSSRLRRKFSDVSSFFKKSSH